MIELSMEQQFQLRSFAAQVDRMGEAKAKATLLNLYGQMMARENVYKLRLKAVWGLESKASQ